MAESQNCPEFLMSLSPVHLGGLFQLCENGRMCLRFGAGAAQLGLTDSSRSCSHTALWPRVGVDVRVPWLVGVNEGSAFLTGPLAHPEPLWRL